ncbi:MAG: flippase-like domain-containing protein [Gemmatimonadetes bacterium]|nr:flippase-like domain-containing protein [Gemmatimonadota bacterium]
MAEGTRANTPAGGMRRLLMLAFAVAVVWFGGGALVEQWTAVREVRAAHPTRWGRVLAASLLTLLSYAVLIETWRRTVRSWGESIGYPTAARIWLVSNLGRYVPGKIWQIGAMSVLAERAGVSAAAAVGSALLVSLVHVVVGFGVVALTGWSLMSSQLPSGAPVLPVLVALAVGIVSLPWTLPWGSALASRISGRAIAIRRLPLTAVWITAVGSAIGWLLFGAAFHVLGSAVLGRATGDAATSIALFTLSYLAGFLALIAPGGIGVREGVLAGLLVSTGTTTVAEATWLVVASRLWLTVLEIVPGSVLLLARPSIRPFSRSVSS